MLNIKHPAIPYVHENILNQRLQESSKTDHTHDNTCHATNREGVRSTGELSRLRSGGAGAGRACGVGGSGDGSSR